MGKGAFLEPLCTRSPHNSDFVLSVLFFIIGILLWSIYVFFYFFFNSCFT